MITIKTNKRKYFKQYLNILKPLLVPKLSNGELNILAELMYLNYKYKNIDVKSRGKLIFDYDSKISIINNLNTSLATLNNVITILRKKNYIKANIINPNLVIDPDINTKLGFHFIIEEDKVENTI